MSPWKIKNDKKEAGHHSEKKEIAEEERGKKNLKKVPNQKLKKNWSVLTGVGWGGES